MMESRLLSGLRRLVGERFAACGPTDLEVYGYDASLAAGKPAAVVFPANTQETADVVRLATAERIPYVVRGSGTNLSGGSVPLQGGVVLCLSRMRRILSMDLSRRCAVVQPGVTNLELQNALGPQGFFFAPDPASQKVSTLGGNVAENSGGPHCLKYGVTENHVLGLELVLPRGDVVRLGGPALDPPGYDLCGVIVGSEGTLGIVTEITVRILPIPEAVTTLLAVYDSVADAAASVSGIIAAGIVPATLEMMDGPVMRAVEESFACGYPLDAAAVLIIEVDGPAAGLQAQAEKIRRICVAKGSRQVREAKDQVERGLLWAGRRGAFGAVGRLAPSYLVADCTVPRTALPLALAQVQAVAGRYGLEHGNVFHAGDGNLHPLLFFDSRDSDQLARVHHACWEIMESCVALGGTITGEHGVGVEKKEAMRLVHSENDLEVHRALRRAFDPDDLCNPGKVIPPPGDFRPWHDVDVHTGPLGPELSPESAEEACEMVRRAITDHRALLPLGGGGMAHFGNTVSGDPLLLASTKLAALGSHDPDNQVVTVGAGMRLDHLQEILAAHGQWLPIRPPMPEGATLGGMTALGACGPERLRNGGPADLLLGLRFVSGKGDLVCAGGKVVKNVAGYELTRLLVGSAGTLGFITELTFRVSQLPEDRCVVTAHGTLEAAASCAALLLRSQLEPTFITAVPASEADDRAEQRPMGKCLWRLAAGFEGLAAVVRWQEARCEEVMDAAGLAQPHADHPEDRYGPSAPWERALYGAPFVLRADLPLDAAARFLGGLPGAFAPRQLFVDFGCGRVAAGLPDLNAGLWKSLCDTVRTLAGHVRLDKAPPWFKSRHDVFGPHRPEWRITSRIKDALDPRNLFAPGRLPGS